MADLFDTAAFRVTDGARFSWKEHSTTLPKAVDKDLLKRSVEKDRDRIGELQRSLYAENTRSLLLIFQAMDAAGKDSCIDHVLSGVNPQGCQVWSFKAPNSAELEHDFLWRHAKSIPERGILGVHNRSHYEEVLVVKVHPSYLLPQRIPGIRTENDADATFWEQRYASIRGFEEHVSRQGVDILKFHLHMSADVQKERFLERIDDPVKNWKFSLGDVKERVFWKDYRDAYAEAIGATATKQAPWYVVPADKQWESRAIVCRIVREHLEVMAPKPPKLSADAMKELNAAADLLRKA